MKTSLFAVLLALFIPFSPACVRAPAPRVLPEHGGAPQKTVCFTFDDGPTGSTTPYVLVELAKEGIKATFFVIGRQIAGREGTLRRTFDEGHTVGIHTYTHEYAKIYASEKSLLCDIGKCLDAIRAVEPAFDGKLYRYPGGSFGVRESLRKAVRDAGWEAHDWNASAEDAVSPGADARTLFKNAVDSAKGKDDVVLLLHDGVGYKETVKALPLLIDYFRSEGYSFRTL